MNRLSENLNKIKPGKIKLGIRKKLILLICLTSLAVMALGAGMDFFWRFQLLRNIVGNNYNLSAKLLAVRVNQRINAKFQELQILSINSTRNELLKRTTAPGGIVNDEHLTSQISFDLKELMKPDDSISRITITDTSGIVVGSSYKTDIFSLADKTWWQQSYNQGKGKTVIEDIELDKDTGRWNIPFIIPINDGNSRVIGICRADIDMEKLFMVFKDFKIGNTGHAGLADKNNNILFHSGMKPLSGKFLPAGDFQNVVTNKIKWFVTNHAHCHEHEQTFISITEITHPLLLEKGLSWLVFVEQDAREVFNPLTAFLSQTIILACVLLSLLIVLGFFMGSKAVKPLEQLRDATTGIIKGNFHYNIKVDTNDEIEDLANSFNYMSRALQATLAEVQTQNEKFLHANQGLNILNALLNLSLEDISIQQFLERTLELIISIPWLALESKGSIFLVEDNPEVLVMRTQKNLEEPLLKKCNPLPFGKCICGQAALTKKTQFVKSVDKLHEITCENMCLHGHYCMPVIYGEKVIGVINIYVKEDHEYQQNEVDFLEAVSHTLAGAIWRKKTEESLRLAYNRLNETQSQLIQAAKMEVVGKLASGVAHEVKNPLAMIIMGIDFLSYYCPLDDESVSSTVKDTKEAVARADKIIRGLLDFASVSKLDAQEEDLNGLINNILLLLKHQFDKNNIEVIKNLADNLEYIKLDRNKIEQALINIFLNAVAAMPEGGKLTINTYFKQSDGTQSAAQVIMEVDDTGTGIPQDVADKLFEPFITTRRGKGGTGLGLAITKNILDLHGAKIRLENKKESKGAKVTIIFPAHENKPR